MVSSGMGLLRSLFDDGREVENSSDSIDISVVVSYDVVMMQVLEYVSGYC